MYSTPALGTLWSHCVNTRLVLEYSEVILDQSEFDVPLDKLRQLTIAKVYGSLTQLTLQSPVSPVVTLFYYISPSGMNLLKRQQEDTEVAADGEGENWDVYVSEIHPWNYWNQAISTKPTDANFKAGEALDTYF